MPPKAETWVVDLYGNFSINLHVDQAQATRYAHYVSGWEPGRGNGKPYRTVLRYFEGGALDLEKPGTVRVTGSIGHVTTGTFAFEGVEVEATSAENAIDAAKRKLRRWFTLSTCTHPKLTFI